MNNENPNPGEIEPVHLSLWIHPEVARSMETMAAFEEINVTELLRRMTGLYSYVKECDLHGKKIIIYDKTTKKSERLEL